MDARTLKEIADKANSPNHRELEQKRQAEAEARAEADRAIAEIEEKCLEKAADGEYSADIFAFAMPAKLVRCSYNQLPLAAKFVYDGCRGKYEVRISRRGEIMEKANICRYDTRERPTGRREWMLVADWSRTPRNRNGYSDGKRRGRRPR